MNYVIYGAQAIALGAYNAIKELHPEINVLCFLVTSIDNNSPTLGGLPVLELNRFVEGLSQEEMDNIGVLIGTPENVMDTISENLAGVGLNNIIRLDSVRWAKMQEMAFIKNGNYEPLITFPVGIHMPDITVFKMVHHKDKKLNTEYADPKYFTRLQVGAAHADKLVGELRDNTLDNISEKNGDYSELTGLYWFWKNYVKAGKSQNRYWGLSHYRRFLELSDDDMKRIQDNEIDVVLPYPMPYEPSIEVHHERYLSDTEWAGVLQAIDELEPEYAQGLQKILNQEYLYNYNIIIAKSKILDDYCTWLFKLLFRIEEINNPDGSKIPNRYLGYVGETLETLYFMHNKDKLKIAHACCRFLA